MVLVRRCAGSDEPDRETLEMESHVLAAFLFKTRCEEEIKEPLAEC